MELGGREKGTGSEIERKGLRRQELKRDGQKIVRYM